MIRFHLKELIADREFRTGKRLTHAEISANTGINRSTLTRISNQNYNATIETLEKLCKYFDCDLGDLVTFVDSE